MQQINDEKAEVRAAEVTSETVNLSMGVTPHARLQKSKGYAESQGDTLRVPLAGLGFYLEKSASLRKNRPMKSCDFCIPVDNLGDFSASTLTLNPLLVMRHRSFSGFDETGALRLREQHASVFSTFFLCTYCLSCQYVSCNTVPVESEN